MVLTVDDAHLGTPAWRWAASPRVTGLAPLDVGRPATVVVVAPHPDDEVLGAGGLIQRLVADGADLHVLAVTDGEASHPHSTVAAHLDLRSVRRTETHEALRRLGVSSVPVTRLGLPDGRVHEHRHRLDDALAEALGPADLCLAPWRRDGHLDHDATGDAAAAAAERTGVRTMSYLVWAWHWVDPDGCDLPWAACRRLELGRHSVARKRWSTGAFRSQIRPLGPHPADAPVLPPAVLRRFWQPFEIYIDERPAR